MRPSLSAAPAPPSPSRRRVRPLLALGAAVMLGAGTLTAVTAYAAVPATPPGWSLVWADDFNGGAGSLPNTTNWRFSIGHGYPGGPPNWGTGEIAYHTNNPANVSLDGAGNLRITPLRDSAGNWTSARIETNRENFKPAAGGVLRIESRLQMPNVTGTAALGYWPAFWALGQPYRGNWWNWPSIGEFDIMENVNGINSVWGVLHCGTTPGGPCNETNGLGASRACPNTACQGNFHTYTFEWDTSTNPQELRWYVDGQQFHRVTATQVGATAWSQMTSHMGYFIILNVAIGGGFPNGVAGRTTPVPETVPGRPMVVDYVAVWARGGTPPSSPPPSSPPPGGTRDAYTTIEAESFNAQSGLVNYGGHIGSINNGNWAQYNNVNFGSTPPRDFVARVASGAGAGVSGLVEVAVDNVNNVIGSFAISNTGGWTSWRTVPGNVSAVTGTRTVFLRFTSGQPADFVDVDWFYFRR